MCVRADSSGERLVDGESVDQNGVDTHKQKRKKTYNTRGHWTYMGRAAPGDALLSFPLQGGGESSFPFLLLHAAVFPSVLISLSNFYFFVTWVVISPPDTRLVTEN